MNNNFNICNLILALGEHDENAPEVRLSRETLEPEQGRSARFAGAFLPPPASFRPRASLDTNTNAAGGYGIQTTIGDTLIAAVRAPSHLFALGARTLTPAPGPLQFGVADSGNAAHWLPDDGGVDLSQTDIVFSARLVKPHTVAATASFSKQLLEQAAADSQQFVIDDIGAAIAAEIDRVGIQGAGTQGEPVGLKNVAAVPVTALGTDGANPTADGLAAMEEAVGKANFSLTGWITTPQMRRRLRRTGYLDSTYSSLPVWSADADSPVGGSVLGYPARATTNCPSTLVKGNSSICHLIACGDFSKMVIPIWDFELVVDKFSQKKRGNVEVTVFCNADICLLKPTAFNLCVDALA